MARSLNRSTTQELCVGKAQPNQCKPANQRSPQTGIGFLASLTMTRTFSLTLSTPAIGKVSPSMEAPKNVGPQKRRSNAGNASTSSAAGRPRMVIIHGASARRSGWYKLEVPAMLIRLRGQLLGCPKKCGEPPPGTHSGTAPNISRGRGGWAPEASQPPRQQEIYARPEPRPHGFSSQVDG